jgi:hypothetical protein
MAHDDKKRGLTDEKLDNKVFQALPAYYTPEGLSSVYSDNVLVLHTENEFILSFFQLEHPYPSGGVGDDKTVSMKTPTDLSQLKARCVSRVIMSPNQMIRVINALQDNLAKYLKKAEEAKKANEATEGS